MSRLAEELKRAREEAEARMRSGIIPFAPPQQTTTPTPSGPEFHSAIMDIAEAWRAANLIVPTPPRKAVGVVSKTTDDYTPAITKPAVAPPTRILGQEPDVSFHTPSMPDIPPEIASPKPAPPSRILGQEPDVSFHTPSMPTMEPSKQKVPTPSIDPFVQSILAKEQETQKRAQGIDKVLRPETQVPGFTPFDVKLPASTAESVMPGSDMSATIEQSGATDEQWKAIQLAQTGRYTPGVPIEEQTPEPMGYVAGQFARSWLSPLPVKPEHAKEATSTAQKIGGAIMGGIGSFINPVWIMTGPAGAGFNSAIRFGIRSATNLAQRAFGGKPPTPKEAAIDVGLAVGLGAASDALTPIVQTSVANTIVKHFPRSVAAATTASGGAPNAIATAARSMIPTGQGAVLAKDIATSPSLLERAIPFVLPVVGGATFGALRGTANVAGKIISGEKISIGEAAATIGTEAAISGAISGVMAGLGLAPKGQDADYYRLARELLEQGAIKHGDYQGEFIMLPNMPGVLFRYDADTASLQYMFAAMNDGDDLYAYLDIRELVNLVDPNATVEDRTDKSIIAINLPAYGPVRVEQERLGGQIILASGGRARTPEEFFEQIEDMSIKDQAERLMKEAMQAFDDGDYAIYIQNLQKLGELAEQAASDKASAPIPIPPPGDVAIAPIGAAKVSMPVPSGESTPQAAVIPPSPPVDIGEAPTVVPPTLSEPAPKAPGEVAAAPTKPEDIAPGKEFIDPTGKRKAYLPPSDINVNADRFQFKQTGEGGVTSLLKGVTEWDSLKAGALTVWKDEDGKYWVVNGHHRLDRAKELGVDTLEVAVLREEDGVTAEDARAIGALQNMAEGRGTDIDAAKFFRDMGATAEDLKEHGLSMKEGVVRDGLALAALTDNIFNAVVQGTFPKNRAIVIGQELPNDPAAQNAVMGLIERYEKQGKTISAPVLQEVIRSVKGSEYGTTTQVGLFGEESLETTNALEKAELIDYVKKGLRLQKKVFGIAAGGKTAEILEKTGNILATEQNKEFADQAEVGLELVSKLAHTKGTTLSELFNNAATTLRGSQNKTAVKKDTLDKVLGLIKEGKAFDDFQGEPQETGLVDVVQTGDGLFGEIPGGTEEAAPVEEEAKTPEKPVAQPITPISKSFKVGDILVDNEGKLLKVTKITDNMVTFKNSSNNTITIIGPRAVEEWEHATPTQVKEFNKANVPTPPEAVTKKPAVPRPAPVMAEDDFSDFSDKPPKAVKVPHVSHIRTSTADALESQMERDDRLYSNIARRDKGIKPKKTIKAYKLFRTLQSQPGKLFPLFIGKTTPTPVGEWIAAEPLPTKGYAERPGWHAGVMPYAPHLMKKDGTMQAGRIWAEVELPADVDWQSIADKSDRKYIGDQIPVGGHYKFQTNKMQGGFWYIGGAIKVNKVLTDEEVKSILEDGGINHAITGRRGARSTGTSAADRADIERTQFAKSRVQKADAIRYRYVEGTTEAQKRQVEDILGKLGPEVRKFAAEYVTFGDIRTDPRLGKDVGKLLDNGVIATCVYRKDKQRQDDLHILVSSWSQLEPEVLAHELAHVLFHKMTYTEKIFLMRELYSADRHWIRKNILNKPEAAFAWKVLKDAVKSTASRLGFYLFPLSDIARPIATLIEQAKEISTDWSDQFYAHLLIGMAIDDGNIPVAPLHRNVLDSEIFAYDITDNLDTLYEKLGTWQAKHPISQKAVSTMYGLGGQYSHIAQRAEEEETVATAIQGDDTKWYSVYIDAQGKYLWGQTPFDTREEAIGRAKALQVFKRKQAKVSADKAAIPVPPEVKAPKTTTPLTETESTTELQKAMRYLSERCDGAVAQDGEGFNGVDADFGHSLAAQDTWTVKQTDAARKMLRKYSGQLERGGFDTKRLFSTPTKGVPIPAEIKGAGGKPTQAAKQIPVISKNLNQNGIEIKFPGKPPDSILEILKTGTPKFRWNGKKKVWYTNGINDANLKRAQEIAAAYTETIEPSAGAAPEATYASRASEVADWVKMRLNDMFDRKLTAKELFAQLDKVFGGTMAEGKYTVKDAYDFMELGVNRYIVGEKYVLDRVSVKAANLILGQLEVMMSNLPTQTKRTTEMDEYQQFSTPPNIAFTAAWVADIDDTDTVLEPSAGVGGLAAFAKNNAKAIYANELSDRRAAILSLLDLDGVYMENAEHLHAILPKEIQPTVVLMNPPFSATAGRLEGKRSTKFATAHIEQALQRLSPNGRLVAIVGRGMSDQAPAFKDWWEKIKGQYNVRANVGLDGKNYRKYGTNFDVQILVIDKTGPTEKGATITESFEDLRKVLTALEGVKNERRHISTDRGHQPGTSVTTRPGVIEESGGRKPVADVSVSAPTSTLGTGKRPTSGQLGTPGTDGTIVDTKQPEGLAEVSDGTTGRGSGEQPVARPGQLSEGERPAGSSSIGDRSTDGLAGQQDRDTGGISVKSAETAQMGALEDTEDGDNPVYSTYVPQRVKIEGAQPHPAQLSESAAMAAVLPPEPTYTPHLAREIITSGTLSIAQLESVVYAGQAHEQLLPSGPRKGYFIGDGTGVGKGRIISGIIMDNFNQGRRRAVWVTSDTKLLSSTIRDWEALGGKGSQVMNMSDIKLGANMPDQDGILFIGYDTMKTNFDRAGTEGVKLKKGAIHTRVEQITKWLGEDGVIVFDEAHKMGNVMPTKGKMGQNKASLRGLVGVHLQSLVPNARVVYSSATMATEPENLGYATRLGIWGKGTAFASLEDFVDKVSRGGVAAMELIARDLKAMGLYSARTLSFQGCEYNRQEHELTPEQVQIYNAVSEAWQIIIQNTDKALEITGITKPSTSGGGPKTVKSGGPARARALGRLWSAQQRFYLQLLTALQMPSILEMLEQHLKEGYAPVISLVNTNEANLNRELVRTTEEEGSLENLDLTPRDIMMGYLDKSFPTLKYEPVTDESGNTILRPVIDRNGVQVEDPEAVALKEEMMQSLAALKIPENPMDMLLNHFGEENVAEVTGRTKRVVRVKDNNGEEKLVLQKRGPNQASADITAFNEGKKQILVFSDAGGTGQSYHADESFGNRKPRYLYAAQTGFRADNATQSLGRVHRTGQIAPPHYILWSTSLAGHKRFLSTIARRLDQLGAFTKGQRQTGGQGFFAATDNLENQYALNALQEFYGWLANTPHTGYVLDGKELTGEDIFKMLGLRKLLTEAGKMKSNDPDLRNVTKFLNRILVLETDLQNQVFEGFFQRMSSAIEQAIQMGTLDMGLQMLKGESIKITDEKTVHAHASGAETQYVALDVERKTNPVQLAEFQNATPTMVRNTRTGNVFLRIRVSDRTLKSGAVEAQYVLISPARSRRYVTISEYSKGNWETVRTREEESVWNKAVQAVPKTVIDKVHLITGALLPIWNVLPEQYSAVYRVETDDGRVLLGKTIEETAVDETLRRLGAAREGQQYTPKEIMSKILADGWTANLANGWTLSRRRVSGDYRIEVIGDARELFMRRKELIDMGCIVEQIQYQYRTFIPVGVKGLKVLEEFATFYPITHFTGADGGKVQVKTPSTKTLEQVEAELTNELRNHIRKNTDLGIVPKAVADWFTKAQTTPFEDADGYFIKDPKIKKRWQEANGVRTLTSKEKLLAAWNSLRNKMSRELEHLPRTAEFADIRTKILALMKQTGVRGQETFEIMESITGPIVHDPKQWALFEGGVVFNDLAKELKAERNLPFGLDDKTFKTIKKELDAEIAKNPMVETALNSRRTVWESIVTAYVEAMEAIDFHVEKRFLDEKGQYNTDYFHHQVLQMVNADYAKYISGIGKKLRTPTGRGWLKHREGSELDINRNYVEAEFEVMSQMLVDIQKAKFIAIVKSPKYNRMNEAKGKADKANSMAIAKIVAKEKLAWEKANPSSKRKPISKTENMLNRMNGRIAWSFEGLQDLSERGLLWDGDKHEYADEVASLSKRYDPNVEPTTGNKVFQYLSALAGTDYGGAMEASTILKYVSHRREYIIKALGDDYKTWAHFIPDGYRAWQPREGNVFYMSNSLPEKLAEQIAQGLLDSWEIDPEDIQRVLAVGGKRPIYILKEEIADTLDNLMKPGSNDPAVKLVKQAVRGWKAWQIVGPTRFIKAQVRNVSGDAEYLFIGNPSAFKKTKLAMQQLYDVFYHNAPLTGDLRQFFERGLFQSTMQVQDLGDVNYYKAFKHLVEQYGGLTSVPENVWKKYWSSARLAADFRESILRYAACLDYLEQMMEDAQKTLETQGVSRGQAMTWVRDALEGRDVPEEVLAAMESAQPKNFGASIPEEIMAITDLYDRAFTLSNQLLGAYDQVSVAGQAFADTLAPFWRFQEVNFKRTIQLFKNAVDDGSFGGVSSRTLKTLAKDSPLMAWKLLKLMAKMAALLSILAVYNHVAFPELEKELSEDVRQKPHIILGRAKDGSVRYFGNLGAVDEFFEWFGLDAPQKLIKDWLSGRITLKGALVGMAKAPVNKLWQAMAWTKMAAEIALDRKTFPDLFDSRPIRDKWLYMFEQFGLGEEYKRLAGLPHRPYKDRLANLVCYTSDPGEGSYYDILQEKRDFLKFMGQETVYSGAISPRSNALYNLKLALRYDDEKAAEKYLVEYIMLGGTKAGLDTSLRNMNPFHGLNEQEQIAFVTVWLDNSGRERLRHAIRFYEQVLLGRGPDQD